KLCALQTFHQLMDAQFQSFRILKDRGHIPENNPRLWKIRNTFYIIFKLSHFAHPFSLTYHDCRAKTILPAVPLPHGRYVILLFHYNSNIIEKTEKTTHPPSRFHPKVPVHPVTGNTRKTCILCRRVLKLQVTEKRDGLYNPFLFVADRHVIC